MKKLFFIVLLAFPAVNAAALELLLEENRGESGTIGYVDIDRVFKEYSGTTGARDEFITEIKRKEDALNAKKVVVFTLKAEIAKLRQEREFALTLPSLMETQRSVAAAAMPPQASTTSAESSAPAAEGISTDTIAALLQSAEISTAAVRTALQVSTATPAVPQVSTVAAHAALQVSTATPAMPQVSTATLAAPQISTVTVHAVPQISTAAPAGMPGLEGIDMPGITKVPVSHFKFSVSTSVPEIDAAITKKENDLNAKEEELQAFQRASEKELLEYESHSSEILLGRIYVALKELAVKEEVSVIVDKRNILFGQNAVDLTDKLLKKLEESGI